MASQSDTKTSTESDSDMSTGSDYSYHDLKSDTNVNPSELQFKTNLDNPADSNNHLRRQIQGLLNRISDATLPSIALQIVQLYDNNTRNSVTNLTTTILLGYIASGVNMPDAFICTYAGFLTCLHSLVREFGAHFIQTLVGKLNYVLPSNENMNVSIDNENMEGSVDDEKSKSDLNFTSLISYLYNFSMINHELIYDLIRKLLEGSLLKEQNIECLLRILKICGFKLRSDDPSSLKEIILLLNDKKSSLPSTVVLSTRTKFMIEFINDLKNNKKKNVGTLSNPIQFERLKKAVSGLLSSKSTYQAEALGCKLKDLQSNNGRWWVIGSAYKGRQPEEKIENAKSSKIHDLAQTLKMNTDSRKQVFFTLMSSEDYKDAVTSLQKLHFKGTGQRDIIRVPLYCLAHEQNYNPFYTLVLLDLLEGSKTNQITFQYALWDQLKSITSKQGQNIAACLYELTIRNVISLDCLKGLDWTSLNSAQEEMILSLLVRLARFEQNQKPVDRFAANSDKTCRIKLKNDSVRKGLLIISSKIDGQDGLNVRKLFE